MRDLTHRRRGQRLFLCLLVLLLLVLPAGESIGEGQAAAAHVSAASKAEKKKSGKKTSRKGAGKKTSKRAQSRKKKSGKKNAGKKTKKSGKKSGKQKKKSGKKNAGKKKNSSREKNGEEQADPGTENPGQAAGAESSARVWYEVSNGRGLRLDDAVTGNHGVIYDEAALLTVDQQNALAKKMEEILPYGSVGFITISGTGDFTDSRGVFTGVLAEVLYEKYISGLAGGENGSGTLFMIDMANRMIYIYSEGDILRVVTRSYADIITDNIYKYATRGEYYQCAMMAFDQEKTLLEGQRITQPMKYAGNLLLALALALFINWLLVWNYSRTKAPTESELLSGIFQVQKVNHIKREFLREVRKHSPRSSGGHGGGHRSGGGHRGGGGGHRF